MIAVVIWIAHAGRAAGSTEGEERADSDRTGEKGSRIIPSVDNIV